MDKRPPRDQRFSVGGEGGATVLACFSNQTATAAATAKNKITAVMIDRFTFVVRRCTLTSGKPEPSFSMDIVRIDHPRPRWCPPGCAAPLTHESFSNSSDAGGEAARACNRACVVHPRTGRDYAGPAPRFPRLKFLAKAPSEADPFFTPLAMSSRSLNSKSSARRIAASGNRGAALLAALCFATVMAIALGSYITVCYRSLAMSTRNMSGTRSIELAETGMEDALWALNNNNWTGWTINGTTAAKTLSGFAYDNGATGSVSISIANYDGTSGTRTVTVTGTTALSDGTTISRSLTSSSAPAPLITNAVAGTTGTVKFTAATTSGVIDSYDSSVGSYSAPSAGYSAIVASGAASMSSATVQLTNAQIKGYVATLSTGPSYSTSAKLIGPTTPATTKIDTARVSTSPYQPVFDIKSISGAGTTLNNPTTNSTTTIGTPGATSASIYYNSGLNMTGTTKIIVDGPVKLVVSGSLYIGLSGGTPSIEVTTNGTLELFVSGDIAIYGNGINNLTTLPKRVILYSTNSLTAPDMNTTTPFYGVIYTPTGDFKVWSNNAIYGAVVARNVVFSGTAPTVHYDVDLRNSVLSGVDTPYAVSNWRETTAGN
jgi:hypothetical protein